MPIYGMPSGVFGPSDIDHNEALGIYDGVQCDGCGFATFECECCKECGATHDQACDRSCGFTCKDEDNDTF
jgi:hypothetical protein